LTSGATYTYTIEALDAAGNVSDLSVAASATTLASIGQWRRHVVSLANTSYSGNPFELEVEATFTHAGSGSSITLPGYYAGGDTWKLGFMPTDMGQWSYVTTSTDPDLNGVTGTVECVPSANRGQLGPDTQVDSRKWRLADGTYLLPVVLRLDFFFEAASQVAFDAAADFMVANNLHMLDTRLQAENTSTMQVFDGNWANHEFNLSLWDQMEARMEALTDRGLGAYIMFYADDAGAPQWSGQSATEALLIRYVVARLAGYPMLIFDTGIDVAEYRSQADVDWMGMQLRALDPYNHPRSSRIGGGSGSHLMSNRTYDSQGDMQAFVNTMTGYFNSTSRPVGMFDAWSENRPSNPEKNFTETDVRRSIWKALVAGGLAVMYRGSDGYFHINNIESDFESEQWLRLMDPFIQQKLGTTFGTMVPSPELVSNGYALADPTRTRIVYFLMGVDDQWDNGNGGSITVQLSSETGSFSATWFDTRTGAEASAGTLVSSSNHTLAPPTADDWVLFLTKN
jgi:hypothetical protein